MNVTAHFINRTSKHAQLIATDDKKDILWSHIELFEK